MLVCLEGPTGAGKSTLFSKFPSEYNRCPEICDFIGGFPTCGKSIVDINNNTKTYLDGEIKASQLIKSNDGFWVQDRNWFSQLTFLLTLKEYCNKSVSNSINQLIQSVDKEEIIIPNLFIYLYCTPSITRERRKLRRTTVWGDVPNWVSNDKKYGFRLKRYQSYEYLFSELPLQVIKIDAKEKISIDFILKNIVVNRFVQTDKLNLIKSIKKIYNAK